LLHQIGKKPLRINYKPRSNADEEQLASCSNEPRRLNQQTFAAGHAAQSVSSFHLPRKLNSTPQSMNAGRLGIDLSTIYLTQILAGAFYGWPYAYLAPITSIVTWKNGGKRFDLAARGR